jgi:hypothetical protein
LSRSLERYAEASTLTLLALTTLGMLIYLVAVLVAFGGEAVLEMIGVLPKGWYGTHLPAIAVAGGIIALPEIAYGAWWLFHRALNRSDG